MQSLQTKFIPFKLSSVIEYPSECFFRWHRSIRFFFISYCISRHKPHIFRLVYRLMYFPIQKSIDKWKGRFHLIRKRSEFLHIWLKHSVTHGWWRREFIWITRAPPTMNGTLWRWTVLWRLVVPCDDEWSLVTWKGMTLRLFSKDSLSELPLTA